MLKLLNSISVCDNVHYKRVVPSFDLWSGVIANHRTMPGYVIDFYELCECGDGLYGGDMSLASGAALDVEPYFLENGLSNRQPL